MIFHKKIIIFASIMTLIGVISLFFFDDLLYLLMPNELSGGHTILSDKCQRCHSPFSNEFETCLKCHENINQASLHAKEKKAVKCSFCHKSHGVALKTISPETCLTSSCHKVMIKQLDHSGDTELCFQCHPEHKFEKRGNETKKTNLIFSHKIHSDESKTKAFSPCTFCHITSFSEITMGVPKALHQCKRCHKKEVAKHDTTRKLKEKECSWCHYPEKRVITGMSRPFQLEFARMKHKEHSGLDCLTCHYGMNNYNELEDIQFLSNGIKFFFCAKCHENKQKVENRKTILTNLTDK